MERGGLADIQRNTKLTLGKYVNAHLLDQGGHFAKNIEYIFGMQYAVEHKQVKDCIAITLRQTRGRQQVSKNHRDRFRRERVLTHIHKQLSYPCSHGAARIHCFAGPTHANTAKKLT